MIRAFLTLLSFSLLLSCAQKTPIGSSTPVARSSDPRLVKAFKEASELLDKRRYAKAAKAFDRLLVQDPSSELDLIILYNSAAAYEGMRRCREAARRYRQVRNLSRQKFSRLGAQATYRLSFAYQCLGDHEKVLVTLLELQGQSQSLDPAVREAELPARLSIAYAMVGNRKLAQKFYRRAERGLGQLKTLEMNPKAKRKKLAKTLFYMGNIRPFDPARTKVDQYLFAIKDLQPFLLKTVELDQSPWSEEAAAQILAAYDVAIEQVKSLKPQKKSSALARRRLKKHQNELFEEIVAHLEELKMQRFPDKKPPQVVKELFRDLGRRHAKTKSYLASNQIGSEMTPQEKKRRALRREGRTYNPNPKLEKQQKKTKVDPNL